MTINEAYKILEISENSSEEEIKLAYKKLAKKYHPDFYQNNPLADLAEEKLKEVNEAYKIIKEFVKIDETIKKNYENNSSNKEIVVKKFQILGYEISFNRNLNEYAKFRKIQHHFYKYVDIDYMNQYLKYKNIEEFLKNSDNEVYSLFYRVFDSLVDIAIENGYNILSVNQLMNNFYGQVSSDYKNCINYLKEMCCELEENREIKKSQEKFKDYIYGRSDVFSATIRKTKDIYRQYNDNVTKNSIYSSKELQEILKCSLKAGIINCINIVTQTLGIFDKLNFYEAFCESTLDNLDKYSLEKKAEKLAQCLQINPFNEEIYKKILLIYGDENKLLEKIAIYFGFNSLELKKSVANEIIENENITTALQIKNNKNRIISQIKNLGIDTLEYEKYLNNLEKKLEVNEYSENELEKLSKERNKSEYKFFLRTAVISIILLIITYIFRGPFENKIFGFIIIGFIGFMISLIIFNFNSEGKKMREITAKTDVLKNTIKADKEESQITEGIEKIELEMEIKTIEQEIKVKTSICILLSSIVGSVIITVPFVYICDTYLIGTRFYQIISDYGYIIPIGSFFISGIPGYCIIYKKFFGDLDIKYDELNKKLENIVDNNKN